MLDIKFIRENPDLIREAARKKRVNFDVKELLKVDEERREAIETVEDLRNIQNEKSDAVAGIKDTDEKEKAISVLKEIKDKISLHEEDLKKINTVWQGLMYQVPNIPDPSVPDGASDADNLEIKQVGEPRDFDFKIKSHIEIADDLDLADFKRGSKVSGFRGYFIKGDAALLNFAVWQLAYEHFLSRGLEAILVPSLVKRQTLEGTGYLPQGEEDLYKTQDGDYLSGTSEVAMMGYYMDEVIKKEELPKKFLGFSVCFRREAGSYGKDTKGLMRVHEFYKLEQLVLCEAEHQESVKHHEWINRNTEEFIETLGLPYRTVINCGADLGLGQVKKYDIELWIPSEGRYCEISSASYFHDFQTRRLNIRYRDTDGKLKFAHSLNSTAIATPRVLIAILENYQNADGSVTVPEIMRKYTGKDKIEKEK